MSNVQIPYSMVDGLSRPARSSQVLCRYLGRLVGDLLLLVISLERVERSWFSEKGGVCVTLTTESLIESLPMTKRERERGNKAKNYLPSRFMDQL